MITGSDTEPTTLGTLDLAAAPLVLGGNVFGWTADRTATFEVLDAFLASGGRMVDTADAYSAWVPGNDGGESETLIGQWLAASGRRDDVVIASKVSKHPQFRGLSASNVAAAARASLQRLRTDRIDLYYAHFDDTDTPIAQTAAAFSRLKDEGLIREIGISNYTPERIAEWFEAVERDGLHAPVALQPHYNLMERGFEDGLRGAAERFGLGVLPYSALASGFLAGSYRDGTSHDSPRARGAGKYLDDRGRAVLAALDEIAAAHVVEVATVSLAWLRAQATIAAPIASARHTGQLPALMASMSLELSAEEIGTLTEASQVTGA
ncbi:aldo/keto reductase [Serinibacter salmoneus]|uniref:Aryl-alcohol dehydrogenase-like predicted oxidoreductase n=1 Tax=Serinibacter salmoneus TaxID=556530 RepID=A0A2A9D1H0_9MICO|nr:aldo/keto reductase [Serinibacter salmoneus]PFG19699.1 aryl-alcohol dehydrogenase-like predicted oxidoreductase [Serinibacter salmoneus]